MIIVRVLVGAQLAMTVADPVPNLNVEPSCRAAASGSIGIQQNFGVCLEDEKDARNALVKEWDSFAPADRTSCTRLSTTGGTPTYTELLTCLELARDAHALHKEDTAATGLEKGSGSEKTSSSDNAPTRRRRHR
jgi:hypothetical protein